MDKGTDVAESHIVPKARRTRRLCHREHKKARTRRAKKREDDGPSKAIRSSIHTSSQRRDGRRRDGAQRVGGGGELSIREHDGTESEALKQSRLQRIELGQLNRCKVG